MNTKAQYNMNMDVKFDFLQLVDVDKLQKAATPWFNQTLVKVNDCVVRLGVVEGEFHWHKHDNEDEFFYVVDGELWVDVEGKESVLLKPNQGYNVPKGIVHRTRAPKRTAMLMIEKSSVTPTGD
jgi:mannose-6-phosphate isomerase-like protein (cupin superfamily)